MQRIQLLSSPYSFSNAWVGATLLASKDRGGWRVHFPHAVGTVADADEGAKTVWFHTDKRVKILSAIPRADKPRYTLITSPTTGDKVWAKVVPSEPSCMGCSYRTVPCMGKTPPCSAAYRHKGDHVIFVTSVDNC